MAIFHLSTNTPTKDELIAAWVPKQPWGPAADVAVESLGTFNLDDPEGKVGMQTHLMKAGDALFQVPLTYREAAVAGSEDALVGTMEHTVLGTRFVYDGLRDNTFLMLLAGVALTGQGPALGMAWANDRWYVAPSDVQLQGGGWKGGPVAVDGFASPDVQAETVTLRNDRFELIVFRRPAERDQPKMGLRASCEGQPNPVVLVEIKAR